MSAALSANPDDTFHEAEGVVNILYGSATGVKSAGNQLLNQATAEILPPSTGFQDSNDRFGASLATGDFNNDGFEDLAIGVPREDLDLGFRNAHGLVYVIYGSPTGLRPSTAQTWTQDSPGIADVAEGDEHFASASAAGDFDNGGFDDLAIGAPRERLETQDDLAIGVPSEGHGTVFATGEAGAVQVLYGATGGLSATGNQFWSQDTAGVADQVERRDRFGAELVAGDFDGGADDLAIGVPGEDLGSDTCFRGKGAVHVLFGGLSRLSATGSRFWTQDSPGIADIAEDGDEFGQALGKGDYDGDCIDDRCAYWPLLISNAPAGIDGLVGTRFDA